MSETRTYRVLGYDKDADAYQVIAGSPSLESMVSVAKAVVYYHANVCELCREGTDEPFDWFTVGDNFGNMLKLFTADHPEGIHLRD